jgi:hypothetical protein
MTRQIKLDAEWTNDCQGKKDYNGHILSISTRYWPAGGGLTLIHNEGGKITIQEGIEGVRPLARSALVIHDKNSEDYIVLATMEFEGDSSEDVARKVEQWAQEQMDRATGALFLAFPLAASERHYD